jgi:hypothetical protein
MGLLVVVLYELYFGTIFERLFPYIISKVMGEGISLFFSFSIILLMGYAGYKGLVSNNIVASFYFWLAVVVMLSYVFHKGTLMMYKVGSIKYQGIR